GIRAGVRTWPPGRSRISRATSLGMGTPANSWPRASWPGTPGRARSRAPAGARPPSPLTLYPWPVTWLPPHTPGSLAARSGQSVRPAGGPASASDLVPLGRFAVSPRAGPRGERLVEVLLTQGSGARGRPPEVSQQFLQRPPRAVQQHHLVV